jgi:hypothetical protein
VAAVQLTSPLRTPEDDLNRDRNMLERFKCLCFNPLNAELNPICHLLALLGGATIVVVSRLRVNINVID